MDIDFDASSCLIAALLVHTCSFQQDSNPTVRSNVATVGHAIRETLDIVMAGYLSDLHWVVLVESACMNSR